jgi:hypothetical protein
MINSIVKIGIDDFCGLKGEALQTNLLHDKVQNLIANLEPLKQSWIKYGCNIVTDHWSHLKKRTVIDIKCFVVKGLCL